MGVAHLFEMLSSFQKGIHHFADNGAWSNDRHLNHDIVKDLRTITRQCGHLRTAFYLEEPDGIGTLQRVIHLRIVLRKLRQINIVAIMLRDQLNTVFENGHHAEPEQIDLDKFQIGTVVFVPLHDDASWHTRGLKRNHGAELSLANDHAAGMLSEMARKVLNTQC